MHKGQSVLDYGAFNIPKRATNVKGRAKVSPACQNATTTTTLVVPAKTYPDGTRTHPPPGDKVALEEVTVTGTGDSTFNDPIVIYDIDWTNAKPLEISKEADGRKVGERHEHGHLIPKFAENRSVTYHIRVRNPNAQDVLGAITDDLPRDFEILDVRRPPETSNCYGVHTILCYIRFPAQHTVQLDIVGFFTHTRDFINRATADGSTADGALLPDSKEAEVIVDMVKGKK
jgi:hypothetical protein